MTSKRKRTAERGSLLVAVMAGVAVAAILSAVAIQEWTDVVRRDNEAEMIFRGQEIARALRRYQKDRGALPNKLDQLLEPGSRGQYFIRKLYEDPLVKDGKWGLLYLGPSGGLLDPNAADLDAGQTLGLSTPDTSALDPGGAERVVPTAGAGGAEVTGLPIAGVKSLCTEDPFRVYQEQTEYAKWLFSIFDLQRVPGAEGGQPGQPGQPGAPGQLPGQTPGRGGRPGGGRLGGARPPGGPGN